MRVISFSRIFILFTFIVFSVAVAIGQDNNGPPDGPPPDVQQSQPGQRDVRGNMLRQLGLTREQMQQIRRLNVERRPMMEEAQRRFRDANRALDEAIYADQVDDAEVQTCLKNVQAAQAEIQRLRYMNELSVRRVLTPEQLVRFREMRARFEQAREGLQDRHQFNNGQPGERPMRNDGKQVPDTQQTPRRLVQQKHDQ